MEAVYDRRRNSFRPSTSANYLFSIRTFVQFCVVYSIPLQNVDHAALAAFTELLIAEGLTISTIRNYFSAIKVLFVWWNKPETVQVLDSQAWSMQLRTVANTIRSPHELKAALSPDELTAFAQACDSHPRFLPILMGALLAFFAYLRVSNLAPQTAARFDPSRHTTMADIIPVDDGLFFRLRWTKTRQHNQPPRLIPIPALGRSPICPVRAWTRYVACVPTPLAQRSRPYCDRLLHPWKDSPSPRSEPLSTRSRVSPACSLAISLPTAYAQAERLPATKQGSPLTTYASMAPGPRTPFTSTFLRLPRPIHRSPELSGTSSISGRTHTTAVRRQRIGTPTHVVSH